MFEINHQIWRIKFVPPYDAILRRSDGSMTVGVTDNATRTIYLSNSLYGNFLKKVICHEITHAAMFAYDVELSLDKEELLADLIATYGEEIINITNTLFRRIKGNY